jgi:hypothetical protein
METAQQKSEAAREARARQAAQRRAVSNDSDLMGFMETVPPEKLDLVISVVAKTREGRAAVLKAASEIAGVDLAEREADIAVADIDGPAADDIDTANLMLTAGDMLTSAAVAERMGQTRQNVNELLKGRRILGVRFGTRWRFPSAQFRHHELLPGLSPVLKAMGDIDPWRMLEVLLAPSAPPEQRPIELLRKGDKVRALAIASRKAAEFRVVGSETKLSGLSAEMEADLEADLRRDKEIDGIRPFAAN